MPKTTKRLLEKLREVEAFKDERRYRPPGMLAKLGKGLSAFFRDWTRIAEHMLSVGPFPRLRKTLVAIGAVSMGPGVLFGVIHALVTSEVTRRGVVTLAARDNPFEFYTLMLVGGVVGTLSTLFAFALLVVLLKGRASRSRT